MPYEYDTTSSAVESIDELDPILSDISMSIESEDDWGGVAEQLEDVVERLKGVQRFVTAQAKAAEEG